MGNQIHTEVMRRWQACGVEVEVVSFAAGLSAPTTTIVDGIVAHQLPLNRTYLEKALNHAARIVLHHPYFIGAAQQYRTFLQRQPAYDLVHVETSFPLGVITTYVPAQNHPPLAVTLPGADVMAEPDYDYGFARFWLPRRLLQRVWRRAALVRADSRQIEKLAIRRGCPAQKLMALGYNITDGDFPPADVPLTTFRAASRNTIRERHGFAPDTPLVLSLSRLHPFKGVEYLVRAVPELLKAAPQVQVVIAGPNRVTDRFGDYGAYLRRIAEELHVIDHIHFVGLVAHEDVRAYMAAADAVVVPSVAEAFNRVAIEAAAVGTPSVVTRTTGAADYILEHGCGLIVEPQSANSIATALRIILTDAERARLLGQHGPAMAAQFRSRVVADTLLERYRSLVAA